MEAQSREGPCPGHITTSRSETSIPSILPTAQGQLESICQIWGWGRPVPRSMWVTCIRRGCVCVCVCACVCVYNGTPSWGKAALLHSSMISPWVPCLRRQRKLLGASAWAPAMAGPPGMAGGCWVRLEALPALPVQDNFYTWPWEPHLCVPMFNSIWGTLSTSHSLLLTPIVLRVDHVRALYQCQ